MAFDSPPPVSVEAEKKVNHTPYALGGQTGHTSKSRQDRLGAANEERHYKFKNGDTYWDVAKEKYNAHGEKLIDSVLAILQKNEIDAKLGKGPHGRKEWIVDRYKAGTNGILPAESEVLALAKEFRESHGINLPAHLAPIRQSLPERPNGVGLTAEPHLPVWGFAPKPMAPVAEATLAPPTGKNTAAENAVANRPTDVQPDPRELAVKALEQEHENNFVKFQREQDKQGWLGTVWDGVKNLADTNSSSRQIKQRLDQEYQQLDALRRLDHQWLSNPDALSRYNDLFLKLTGSQFDANKPQDAHVKSTSDVQNYRSSQKLGVDSIATLGALAIAVGTRGKIGPMASGVQDFAGLGKTMALDAAKTAAAKWIIKASDYTYLDTPYDVLSGLAVGAGLVPAELAGTGVAAAAAKYFGKPMAGSLLTGQIDSEGAGLAGRALSVLTKHPVTGAVFGGVSPFTTELANSLSHQTDYDFKSAAERAKFGVALGAGMATAGGVLAEVASSNPSLLGLRDGINSDKTAATKALEMMNNEADKAVALMDPVQLRQELVLLQKEMDLRGDVELSALDRRFLDLAQARLKALDKKSTAGINESQASKEPIDQSSAAMAERVWRASNEKSVSNMRIDELRDLVDMVKTDIKTSNVEELQPLDQHFLDLAQRRLELLAAAGGKQAFVYTSGDGRENNGRKD